MNTLILNFMKAAHSIYQVTGKIQAAFRQTDREIQQTNCNIPLVIQLRSVRSICSQMTNSFRNNNTTQQFVPGFKERILFPDFDFRVGTQILVRPFLFLSFSFGILFICNEQKLQITKTLSFTFFSQWNYMTVVLILILYFISFFTLIISHNNKSIKVSYDCWCKQWCSCQTINELSQLNWYCHFPTLRLLESKLQHDYLICLFSLTSKGSKNMRSWRVLSTENLQYMKILLSPH